MNMIYSPFLVSTILVPREVFLCALDPQTGEVWAHPTDFSEIEQKHSCFRYLPATAVPNVSSISIPIKCSEVSALLGVTFWEEPSSTNAMLENKKPGEVSW